MRSVVTYSGLGEMSSATHECAGNNVGGRARVKPRKLRARSLGPQRGQPAVILKPREGRLCSGEPLSRFSEPAYGPSSRSVTMWQLRPLRLWVPLHFVSQALPIPKSCHAARGKLWLLSLTSSTPLSSPPLYGLSAGTVLAVLEGQSVVGDKWEPGKGSTCSSELSPGLMAVETMMGQSRFPEWSWSTPGLTLTPCAVCHIWPADGSTPLGRPQDGSELTPLAISAPCLPFWTHRRKL